MPLQRIRAFAHVFDFLEACSGFATFFGGMFRVRNGVATVPGGDKAVAAWTELAGVGPDKGVAFLEKIVTKDDGWLASYFDSLSRISGSSLEYLTDPVRLRRNYAALRGKVTSPGPARPVFRANTDLMLLTHASQCGERPSPDPGRPRHVEDIFREHTVSKLDARLSKASSSWTSPDDLVEAIFGLSP